jgi:hypothetical protein
MGSDQRIALCRYANATLTDHTLSVRWGREWGIAGTDNRCTAADQMGKEMSYEKARLVTRNGTLTEPQA